MNRISIVTRFTMLLAIGAAIAVGHAYSLPPADLVVTIELPERNVEQLAERVDAALVSNGFIRLVTMKRVTLDMHELPTSASSEDGVVLSKFEKPAVISVFAQVTTCRAAFSLRLADHMSKADGERQLRLTREALVKGLPTRKEVPLTITGGLSTREDPCVVPMRSNTSLERTREG